MAQARRGPPAGGRLPVGACCYFKWSDGLWYPAKVMRAKADDDGNRSVSMLFEHRKSIIKGQVNNQVAMPASYFSRGEQEAAG